MVKMNLNYESLLIIHSKVDPKGENSGSFCFFNIKRRILVLRNRINAILFSAIYESVFQKKKKRICKNLLLTICII